VPASADAFDGRLRLRTLLRAGALRIGDVVSGGSEARATAIAARFDLPKLIGSEPRSAPEPIVNVAFVTA